MNVSRVVYNQKETTTTRRKREEAAVAVSKTRKEP
jgi:hypothetical protein